MTEIRDLTNNTADVDPSEHYIQSFLTENIANHCAKNPKQIIRYIIGKAIQWGREHERHNQEKNPIRFAKILYGPEKIEDISSDVWSPEKWKHVYRTQRNFRGYDVIHAWNDDETHGIIFLGHWNDGVINTW